MNSELLPKIRVIFVCLGNICRSPMAEAVFAHKVKAAGLAERIEADSAGTGDWHLGEPAHRGTRQILDREGIAYEGRSRLLTRADLDQFDYVVTMGEQNYRNVLAHGRGRAQIRRFTDFAPHLGHREVPDPYYDGRYELVYEIVSAAADGLLAHIRREHEI